MKLADRSHPITVTSKNVGNCLFKSIDQEFYWEEKCKEFKNVLKPEHGGSYKQAYVEIYI